MGSTSPERSALMKRVRQKDTNPELVVRKALRAIGANYRVNVKDLPGSPDIASKIKKRAIFVHGCFWHGHENCSKHRIPKTNQDFWRKKFESNIDRDRRKIEALEARGFQVMVVWECQLPDGASLERRLTEFWFS